MKNLLIILGFSLALSHMAVGQDFDIKRTEYELPEQGKMLAYNLISQGWLFRFAPPTSNCSIQEEKAERRLTFKAPDNSYGVTLQVTTNFVGGLPSEQVLKNYVLDLYPDGNIFQSTPVATGMGAAAGFDLSRVPSLKTRLTTRVVFVHFSEGTVVVTFSVPSASFFDQRQVLSNFLGSLKIEQVGAGKE